MRSVQPIIRCLSLCLILAGFSVPVTVQSNQDEWVHLGTLWDAPGSIGPISTNSEFVILGGPGQTQELIRIESGEVLFENNGGDIIFSPDSDYAVRYEFVHEFPYRAEEFEILDLHTGRTTLFDGFFGEFLSGRRLLIESTRGEDFSHTYTTMIDLTTGDVIADYNGWVGRFSRDMSLVVVASTDIDTGTVYVHIIEVATNEPIAEFNHPIPEYPWSISSAFNLGDSLLALYFFPDEMLIISTDTWETLYTLPGAIRFSPDGQYIASNNHAGYSEVQLIESHTGQIFDEFVGSLGFSSDGRYWIRGEAITYDLRHWQVIDLNTGEVVFELENFLSSPLIHENDVVQVWNIETQSARFFDLHSGELLREINGFVERWQDIMIVGVERTPFLKLQNWQTSETFAVGRQIKVTPDGRFALVSNRLFVDVYGRVDERLPNLPPPRPEQGIARIGGEEILVYPEPESDTPRAITEGNMLNPTYFDVLGKAEIPGWLFVSFSSGGRNPEMISGWIRSEGLVEIESWGNVPILDVNDPIGSLKSIAFRP